jgi:uncharacterized membrane protein
MDCYYHNAVPPVATCTGCKQPICATCRSAQGDCPGCRLAARIAAAAATAAELPGDVPPRRAAYTPPPPPTPPPYVDSTPVRQRTAVMVRPESRALVALSYPFWPLALLALLDGSKSPYLRRQALQALGFNFGVYGIWLALSAIAGIPLLGISAYPLLPLVIPVAIVASVVYGFKAWQGEDVRIPVVSEFIDARLPASE